MSIFGAPNIEKLEKRKDIDGLIKALSYQKDKQIRDNAALALARLGEARAVEPLITILTAEGPVDIKETVIWILGKLGDSRAIQPLIEILDPSTLDPFLIHPDFHDRKVKDIAIDALFEIGEPAFVAMVRAHTVEPLIALMGETRLQNFKDAMIKSLNFRDSKSYAPLFNEAEKKYAAQRKAAAIMLGMIGDTRAVEPLISELPYMDYRETAASALINIGSPAVEPLIAALKDANGQLRAAAAELLGKLGDKRALEPLIKALKDREINVRKNAAVALGIIGDDHAIKALLAKLTDNEINQTAADSLTMLGWKPTRDQHGVQYYIVRNAWEQCVEMGETAVEPLIALLEKGSDKKMQSAAVKTLGQIRDMRAVDPLIRALITPDNILRENAAAALGKIGDDRAIPFLIAALQSDDYTNIKSVIAEALSNIGTPAVEPLINLLGSDQKLDLKLIEALGVIGDQRAIEPLMAALKNNSKDMRKVAANALGQIGDARVVKPLITALDDEYIYARNAAARSLVALYTSGKLNPEDKQLILAHKPAITKGHDDTHVDIYSCSFNIRDEGHSIPGTGVEFPL